MLYVRDGNITDEEKKRLMLKVNRLHGTRGKVYKADVLDIIMNTPENQNNIKIAEEKMKMERQALEDHMQEGIYSERGKEYIEGKYVETQYVLSLLNELG